MLAIAGGKGGCGKTTTTLGLAAAYARRRRRPLVVDADRGMPNCHLYAGTRGSGGVDAVAAGDDVASVAEPAARVPGVDVLAGGDADPRDYLGRLPRGRPVLLDTAAGASADVGHVLAAAEASVVVTTAAREAIEDGMKTAALSRTLGTPVAAGVLVGTDAATDGVERALGASVTPIPSAEDPLASSPVATAYDGLAVQTEPNH